MNRDDRVRMISKIDVGSLRRKVVRCVSSADVAAAVDFAKQSDLEIGGRCGGHSVLGISVPDGGVLIDLSGDCGGASQHSVAAWRQHR